MMSFHRPGLNRALSLAALAALPAQAGSWANPGGGSWAAPANWDGAAVPDGAGMTAAFDQVDITRPMLVTLDGPKTAGQLAFGDIEPSHVWFVR